MPLVGSNQSLYYEVWIEWEKFGALNNEKWISVKHPNIGNKALNAPEFLSKYCTQHYAGQIVWATGRIDGAPIDASKHTYYVDIQFFVDGGVSDR